MEHSELRAFLQRFDMEDRRNAVAFLRAIYHSPPFYIALASWELQTIFRRPWLRRLVDSFRPEHLMSPEELSTLPMPVLLLWGKGDRLMLPSMLAWFRHHLPGHALVEEPEDFGHVPHLERPRKLAQRLLAFTRGL
jgi:pimeloyl-ACP methyl ester carboxylesterase